MAKKIEKNVVTTSDFSPWFHSCLEYESDGAYGSQSVCLEVAVSRIKSQYNLRVEPKTGMPFAVFWKDIAEFLRRPYPDGSASQLAVRVQQSPLSGAEPFGALYTAGAFWCEANRTFQEGKCGRSWAALLQCYFFLGVASGPKAPSEMASDGGSRRADSYGAFFKDFRLELLQRLRGLPENEFHSVKDAVAMLLPGANAFREEWRKGQADPSAISSQNLGPLMIKWTRQDGEVRAAFTRICKGGIGRGRPRKSVI